MKKDPSYHQERLWFIDRFESGNLYESSPVYHNIPLVLEIEGTLDINALERSIQAVIDRHNALRTRIVTIDSEPFQHIEEELGFNLDRVCLNGGNNDKHYDNAVRTALEYAGRPFLIDKDPLIRGLLISIDKKKHMLVFVFHHIIMDKYAVGIFTKELFVHYEAYSKNRVPQLYENPPGYVDFSQWQRELPDSVSNTLLSYWKRKLGGKLKTLEIPMDRPRSPVHIFQGERQSFRFSKILSDRIKEFSKQDKVSHFVLLLAAFKVLLYRYSGLEEIVVGTSGENRNQPGMRGIIGPIANLLVLRSKFSASSSFRELLTDLNKTVTEAYKYQAMPFDLLVLELKPAKDMSRTALFDVLFQYEENPLMAPDIENLAVKVIETNLGWGKYDLNMLIQRGEDSFSGILVYNKKYYNDSGISLLLDHYQVLLEGIFLDDLSTLEISGLPILTEKEKLWLLVEWNQTQANYPADKTIQRVFEDQVKRTPERIAVVFQDSALTFRELNQQSNRLANVLRNNYNIKANTHVGIMMTPSLEMMVGILGILKAGGAYVPLDPDYPMQRIVTMLEDCQSPLVLTTSRIIKGKPMTVLQGISVIKVQPYVTDLRPQITDLDALPFPDRSLVDYENYQEYISFGKVKNCISLQGSRGCPYRCAYCHKIWPKKHVCRSAENLLEEVRLYYDMGIRRFAIIDDIFNVQIKNSSRFFELILKEGLDVHFFFPTGIRGDILTEEYIDLMIEAGAINFALALETASPRLQKLIGKNLNIKKLRENIEYICKKYPYVISELFTMHGFPSETEEEAMSTLDFIKSLKWLHFPYINILRIYLNTDMEKLAIEHGISRQDIIASDTLSQHDFSRTLPFDESFTKKYQSEFLNEYFLSKERLLYVLPYQMKVFTRDEMAQRYDSYLPVDIRSFEDFLEFAGIREKELILEDVLDEESIRVSDLNEKIRRHFPAETSAGNALRILLLDLSQFFQADSSHMLYDVHEPPLGLMNLMTYLKRQLGEAVIGKIAKSRVDFDSYAELRQLLDEFKPDIIGIRSLTFYKEFFHETVAMIRQWGIADYIIAGGPYATSDYETILQDRNIKLVVRGEGEETFVELVRKIIENGGKLPGEKVLKEIKGLAFIPGEGEALYGKFSREILLLDELIGQLAGEPGDDWDMANINQSDDLAYAIFTSGSTGKPKGCMISHRNVVRLLKNDRLPFDFAGQDTWIMAHSFCFDFSVWEMYGALLNGGKLIIPSRDSVRDVNDFHFLIRKHSISILNQTPGAFYSLTAVDKKSKPPVMDKYLRCVIFGGDKLLPLYLQEWTGNYSLNHISLINMYGITETTVHVTYHRLTRENIVENNQVSPIGKPLPETTIYILDEKMSLQPIGVPGELYIGGGGLCRGYLNRSILTEERFIKNPYNDEEVIYRSGDLGRWLCDGSIEYLGRIDHQVKIRGYRIELGEIENQILTHDEISETVVIDREDASIESTDSKTGDKYLCAYIVSRNGVLLPAAELRDYLFNRLPEYMVPSYFVQLDEIPLTLNGKIDRKSLPDPELKAGEEYAAPKNYTEKKLVEIFSGVLGSNEGVIGIDSDFFEFGGHSVKAMNLIARIHKELAVRIPISELFRKPTVRELAESIRKTKREEFVSIKSVEKKEYYVLSSAQSRTFFLQQMMGGTAFNLLRVVAVPGTVNKEQLEITFKRLIDRHEAFRTSIEIINDQPVQRIHREVNFEIEYYEASRGDHGEFLESETGKIIENFVRPFDFSQAPFIRVGLIETGGNRLTLMVDIHHIVSDYVSMEVTIGDFIALDKGEKLPALRIQYKDYTEWQGRLKKSDYIKEQENYWLETFACNLPQLDLPIDFPRPGIMDFKGDVFTFMIDEYLSGKIGNLISQYKITTNILLVSVYSILLSKYSGEEDIIIGSPIVGRSNVELENVVGMFANLLALRTRPGGNKIFKNFLGEVKEHMLDSFENQDYQFEELIDKLDIKVDSLRQPLVETVITFYNADDEREESDSLRENAAVKLNTAHYDLYLGVVEMVDKIKLGFVYSIKLYKPSTIGKFAKHYIEILEQVIENDEILLKDITLSYDRVLAKYHIFKEDQGDFVF